MHFLHEYMNVLRKSVFEFKKKAISTSVKQIFAQTILICCYASALVNGFGIGQWLWLMLLIKN